MRKTAGSLREKEGGGQVSYVEAVGDVEEGVDEDTVTVSLELKVPEEDIGLEEGKSLVNDVHLVSLGARGGTTDLGLERQNEKVADGLVVTLVEAGVVGLIIKENKKMEFRE